MGNLGSRQGDVLATLEVWQRRVKSSRWLEVLQGRKQGMAISMKEKITVSAG